MRRRRDKNKTNSYWSNSSNWQLLDLREEEKKNIYFFQNKWFYSKFNKQSTHFKASGGININFIFIPFWVFQSGGSTDQLIKKVWPKLGYICSRIELGKMYLTCYLPWWITKPLDLIRNIIMAVDCTKLVETSIRRNINDGTIKHITQLKLHKHMDFGTSN